MAAPSKPPTHASCTGPPRPSHGRCDRVLLHRRVYSLSVSPDGESLLTGSADGTVRLWEVATARCERSWHVGGEKGEEVRCVAFSPSAEIDMAAVVVGNRLLLLLPGSKRGAAADRAHALLSGGAGEGSAWTPVPAEMSHGGAFPWQVTHVKQASMAVWHHAGDYLASVCPEGATKAVLMHQVSKRTSGSPFSKSKGRVESVAFHPTKPLFFVATQRHVRVYHLLRQVHEDGSEGASPPHYPVLTCPSGHRPSHALRASFSYDPMLTWPLPWCHVAGADEEVDARRQMDLLHVHPPRWR